MTVYLQTTAAGRSYGTYQIDKVVKGKRIKVTTGTKDKRVAREMENVLDDLKNLGLDEKLDAFVQKKINIRQLYQQKLNGTLFQPAADPIYATPLKPALDEWVKTYRNWSEGSRKNNQHLIKALYKRLPADLADPLIADIPRVLRFYSEYAEAQNIPRVYNLARAVISRFVSKKFGTLPQIWREIKDVKNLPNTLKDPLRARTPAQIEKLCRILKPKYREMVWTMCSTGVGWDEYGKMTASVDIKNPRVTIAGTKMDKKDGRRRREVPLVFPPTPRTGSNEALVYNLKAAEAKARIGRIRPYTFRKCYSVWARECGVPDWRVEMYMGHAAKSMTAKYQTTEIWGWLRDDGKKLREYIDTERRKLGQRDVGDEILPQQQPFQNIVE